MKIMSIFANKEPGMGNFIKQQEERKDAKERDRLRRDKIAGYFFQRFEQVRAKEFTYFAEREKRRMKSTFHNLHLLHWY